MDEPAITIKGRSVQGHYPVTLEDLFSRVRDQTFDITESDARLAAYQGFLPGLGCKTIELVFPPAIVRELRPYARYPCVMGDAPAHKVRLNLMYQDTRIKLAVEDRTSRKDGEVWPERDVLVLLEAYAVILRTSIPGLGPIWRHCTDNDLDALTFGLVNSYDPGRNAELLRTGHQANANSLATLGEMASLGGDVPPDVFLEYQVHAGTVWWGESPPHCVERGGFAVNDFGRFAREALVGPCTLVFLFDDNGELAWDLMMLSKLLAINHNLLVTGVTSRHIVENNANTITMQECLRSPLLAGLDGDSRFRIFVEDNVRSAIDPSYCSRDLLDLMNKADLLFIKGASFFETVQAMEVPSYYAFVVHSHESQLSTGFDKGAGVFVRTPKGTAAFDYGKTCLRDLYPGWNTPP